MSLKLPSFWTSKPEIWFIQVEAQFNTRVPPIVADKTKFDYVVGTLDSTTAGEVESILLCPPEKGAYDTLKQALIKAYGKSQQQKDYELLNMCGLGDRKPSALLRHIRSLNSDPNTLLRAVFLNQMPLNIRTILASSPEKELEALAEQADKMVEVNRFSNSMESNISATYVPSSNTSNKGPDEKRKLCFFHSRFGKRARKCVLDSCPMKQMIASVSVSSKLQVKEDLNSQAGHQ